MKCVRLPQIFARLCWPDETVVGKHCHSEYQPSETLKSRDSRRALFGWKAMLSSLIQLKGYLSQKQLLVRLLQRCSNMFAEAVELIRAYRDHSTKGDRLLSSKLLVTMHP